MRFLSKLVLALCACSRVGAQGPPFVDGFETERGWFLFEEIVGGNPCYAKGVGTMSVSTERAYGGERSLRLSANEARTRKSNHLIAVNRLSNQGRKGRWTYSAHIFIPVEPSGYQTGPEMSIQNTRRAGANQFLTHTAAVQYLANRPADKPHYWAVWRKNAKGEAAWDPVFPYEIKTNQWYRVSMEVDYDTNRYGWLTIQGEDGTHSVDLTESELAPQSKHNEEAFAITLEGENLWSNCGEAGEFRQRFFYDDVSLVPTPKVAVGGVHPSAGKEARQRFVFEFQGGSEDRPVSIANVLFNRTLDPRLGCYLAYATGSGLLHLMDESGTRTLEAMQVNVPGTVESRQCRVHSANARREGARVILELDLSFQVPAFSGNHTIYLAARDARDGNSGWVAAGRWSLTLP